MAWATAAVRGAYDLLAPDGSEIRLLPGTRRASMVHCSLPAGQVTLAVRHASVDELWYCVAGAGAIWRKDAQHEEIVDLRAGVALSLPVGTSFQFRAHAEQALELVIVTIPPWPGAQEAEAIDGPWQATTNAGL